MPLLVTHYKDNQLSRVSKALFEIANKKKVTYVFTMGADSVTAACACGAAWATLWGQGLATASQLGRTVGSRVAFPG